jgi:hypothetical protein
MFLSLDGVLQGPGDPDEVRQDEFEHGGWQLAHALLTASAEGTTL